MVKNIINSLKIIANSKQTKSHENDFGFIIER